ncbi:Tryptophan 2,3-dioxygenase [Holothuria leucospilota]|uniref:Tryptophan 2,3-dioxygenase n=1 Tax=Holothuria leucospilota TaxID=206669 RepID=A0A9Q1BJP7_HOLLE|nr:Tryptophan 2,3-dioxygenase [Holothuria leucospilota]
MEDTSEEGNGSKTYVYHVKNEDGELQESSGIEEKGLSYGEYLKLDQLLSSQDSESAKHGKEIHDEHLFIIIHQGKS